MDHDKKIVLANFFPPCENIHLTKEVGEIPYFLGKDFGYDAFVVSYRNGEYPYADSDVKGLRMVFMRRGLCRAIQRIVEPAFKENGFVRRGLEALCTAADALPVLIGRRIDVLMLNHLDDTAIAMAWLYKAINRRGIVYIKLDLDPGIIGGGQAHRGNALYRTVPCDLMSVETRALHEYITVKHPFFSLFRDRLFYLPNGIDVDRLAGHARGFGEKEDIVLHAGRVGARQKASEVVLEAFGRAARDFPGWRLILIGPMEGEFEGRFNSFLESNGDIRDRIAYLGFVDPREKVFEYYSRAKVFMFPSRFESFGFAAAEAEAFGCAVLGSDIPATRELTDGGRCALLCPVDDGKCFEGKLRYLFSDGDALARLSGDGAKYVRDHYGWHAICGDLDGRLREKLCEKGRRLPA